MNRSSAHKRRYVSMTTQVNLLIVTITLSISLLLVMISAVNYRKAILEPFSRRLAELTVDEEDFTPYLTYFAELFGTEEMQKAIDMLNEVKESIMNAYEIKSGLSRHKISQLMDAETWMNAKEAMKLGFADEVLFRDGEEPVPEDTADTEMLFSRKAVTDSLLSRLIPKKKPEANTHMVPVTDLEKRLSLLAH